jgi:hypothetical protein
VRWGEAATAALIVATGSGAALAIPYDPSDALTSIATLLLANPAASFFRNLHYWSAQLFLLLSLAHAWDHVRRRDARPLRLGAWTRVCASVPVIGLLAWSGFVLKGDVEAWQAWRVVATTLRDVPVVGDLLVRAILGRTEQLSLVYVHHAATFTLFVWIVSVEHGRVVWPRTTVTLAVLGPSTLLSLFVSPQLHDGLGAVVKGPWYFVGLQEAFHWSPWPSLVLGLALLPLGALFAMRWMGPRARAAVGSALLATLLVYGAATGVAWTFRGANWRWTDAWRTSPASLVVAPVFAMPDPSGEPLRGRPLPIVMGRPEGCLVCHAGITGLSASHEPATIGCASCHGGNVFSLDADVAHRGMHLVPGNLAELDRTCGGDCHPAIASRVRHSLMTSNAGIVAVNLAAWNELASTDPEITRVGSSPAGSHLRQLCATCHLGTRKAEPWPITEDAGTGGCVACHLAYSPGAFAELQRYRAEPAGHRSPPRVHPDVSLPSSGAACFGCHSRSGRISLSYEGWYEASPLPSNAAALRRLDDGRDVVQASPDAHALKGMGCVDCHTATEVMGDGVRHRRQLDQIHVACTDCHATARLRSVALSDAGEEPRRLVALRKSAANDRRLVITRRRDALTNTLVDAAGNGRLVTKGGGVDLALDPVRPECIAPAHARVSCIGCHNAWAPRCPTCHTRFDAAATGYDAVADAPARGEWLESGTGFGIAPPTLGVRRVVEGGVTRDLVEPFIPGMIATLDPAGVPGGAREPVFRRWYSRSVPHTVSKAGRNCRSCHNDPVALGYGEGRLEFAASAPAQGRWRFTPRHDRARDGLPTDAWIGFLQVRTGDVSSRDDVRPLAVSEQRSVLSVGACLTCHEGDDQCMKDALVDFERVQRRTTSRCLRAVW